MTMNCLAIPTQQTGEPEAPARASVPERFRCLKRNEVVWSGDFVADERLGFELWEAPDVFRAGSFARPIYQKEETERFRPTSTRKPKQKITVPFEHAGTLLELRVEPDTIAIFRGRNLIAHHPRSYARNRDIENPDHLSRLLAERKRAEGERGCVVALQCELRGF